MTAMWYLDNKLTKSAAIAEKSSKRDEVANISFREIIVESNIDLNEIIPNVFIIVAIAQTLATPINI